MLKVLFLVAFLANAVLHVSSTAVATASSSGNGDATANSSQCGGRPNEHYETCPDSCAPQNCSQLGFPIGCPGATPDGSCATKPACVCNQDYARNDRGICVPKNQCPSCGGDPNAQSGCGNCPKTCQNYNSTEPIYCPQFCDLNGCDCKDDFVLDENTKKCVSPKDCTPTCGSDEYFSTCANGGCHDARTCEELDTLDGTYICEDPAVCKPGCLCKDSLLRNSQGKCVPENQCPNSKCKGEFETYVKCDAHCMPETCNELGFPLPCAIPPSGSSCPGKSACICRSGYVKDETGKCVPIDQCPSCGGDPNAKSGCGTYCGNRCSNYDKGPVACPLVCLVNGCDCKPGFVYDDNIEKCVLPEKCSPTCGQNEQYTSCVEGGCVRSARNCSQVSPGEEVPIVCIRPINCTAGCICRDGFYRNSNGVCVSQDDCQYDDVRCVGRPNEFWDTCPLMCTSETCAGSGKPVDCPPQAAVCRPSCRCAQGYYRNSRGICVPEKQCTSSTSCPVGQTLGCGNNCNRKCSNYRNGTSPYACATIACAPSSLTCQCDPSQGYYYDDTQSKCVPEDECPL